MITGKTIALSRWTFVGKVMSLLFNMLSRLVITFLPRSKLLLISWLQSPSAVLLETKKMKYVTISAVSTSIYHEVILWPPDVKSWLIRKDPDAGKDWEQEEKGTTEDEMVGWHHKLNGCEFEQTLGDGEGQGSLNCCNQWGQEESDMRDWATTTKLSPIFLIP